MRVRQPFWALLSLGVLLYLAGLNTQPPANQIFIKLVFFIIGIILLCLGWAFFSVVGLDINRRGIYSRQQVGQMFEERIEIINRGMVGHLWVEITDVSNLPKSGVSRVISSLRPKQKRVYVARTLLLERGEFLLGPTKITSGDPLGLFVRTKIIINDKTLLVLPYWTRLDYFYNRPGLLSGGRALRRKNLEVSPHAAGIREYLPGDPISRIHWKTTAKRDRLMVKEFEQDPQADIWILIDGSSTSNYAQVISEVTLTDRLFVWLRNDEMKLPPDTFEYAVSIAASVAYYYIRQGRSVGLGCAGQRYISLPAERGERQMGKIFETLALIRSQGKLPLRGLVESQSHIARGSTVVLISAAGSDEIDLSIDLLQRRDLRPIAIFIDQKSFGGITDASVVFEKVRLQEIPTILIHRDDTLAALANLVRD